MRPTVFRLALSLIPTALLAMSGCKPDYPACKKNNHCKQEEGEKCVDGQCQNCVNDEQCLGKGPNGEDFTCFQFRCTDPSLVPEGGEQGAPGELGSPCTQSIECSGGLVCTGGQCSACTDNIECSPGTCDINTGRCITAAGTQCTNDDQCTIDEICDNGTCIFSGTPPAGENPCGIDSIFFSFDSPKISDEAAQQLRGLSECIKNNGNSVILEAHADPRGTEEYNILLTDRRGQSVKRFMTDLGVSGESLQVISKGNLEATGTDEASFAKDRRVDFIFQ